MTLCAEKCVWSCAFPGSEMYQEFSVLGYWNQFILALYIGWFTDSFVSYEQWIISIVPDCVITMSPILWITCKLRLH